MELNPGLLKSNPGKLEQHMPKTLRTIPASKTEVQWKYVRNLFFGQKVLDELRILMRLSADTRHAGADQKTRRAICTN